MECEKKGIAMEIYRPGEQTLRQKTGQKRCCLLRRYSRGIETNKEKRELFRRDWWCDSKRITLSCKCISAIRSRIKCCPTRTQRKIQNFCLRVLCLLNFCASCAVTRAAVIDCLLLDSNFLWNFYFSFRTGMLSSSTQFRSGETRKGSGRHQDDDSNERKL